MPNAATNQMVAAVVNPRTWLFVCSIAPAPRKPTPVTIPAATRAVSCAEPCRGKASMDRIVKRHELTAITMLVRRPAGWPVHSRSRPTMAPKRAARAILPADSQVKDCNPTSQSAFASTTIPPHSNGGHCSGQWCPHWLCPPKGPIRASSSCAIPAIRTDNPPGSAAVPSPPRDG